MTHNKFWHMPCLHYKLPERTGNMNIQYQENQMKKWSDAGRWQKAITHRGIRKGWAINLHIKIQCMRVVKVGMFCSCLLMEQCSEVKFWILQLEDAVLKYTHIICIKKVNIWQLCCTIFICWIYFCGAATPIHSFALTLCFVCAALRIKLN